MITVALIDDHLIVRSGFAQLLGLEPDLQVVAEFGSGREALAGLPGRGVQAERYGDDYALRSRQSCAG